MKNPVFLIVIGFLSSLMLFNSCSKDDHPSRRVCELRNYVNDNLGYVYKYAYQEELLFSSVGSSMNISNDSTKTDYDYPDQGSMIEVGYSKSSSQWQPSVRIEYEFDHEKVVLLTFNTYFSSSEYIPYRKIEYVYDGANLISEIWYSFNSEGFAPISKTTYEYSGKKLLKSIFYNYEESNWRESKYESVYYVGNEVDSIVTFRNDEKLVRENKYEYQYSNGRISRINQFGFMQADSTWKSDGYREFAYDGNENLVSSSILISNTLFKSEYGYEDGKGNYEYTVYRLSGASQVLVPLPD